MATSSPQFSLGASDALLVIDMQRDFLPGGPLAVRGGDELVPGIHRLAGNFDHVILTQDWHPAGHISFASAHPGQQPFTGIAQASYGPQSLWPDHCLQGSAGADFAAGLDLPQAEMILRKGFRRGLDSYSAFIENDRTTATGLAGYLHDRGLRRLFFAGLAFDFCLGHSALDALRLGFEALVVTDLTRSVDLPGTGTTPGTVMQMQASFAAGGPRQITTSDLQRTS